MQQQMMMMQMMGQNPMMGQQMMNAQMGMMNPQMAMMGQAGLAQQQLPVPHPIERDVNWLKNNLDTFKNYSDSDKKNLMGTLMYSKILGVLGQSEQAIIPKITGMLIDLEVLEIDEIVEILTDDTLLRERIVEAQAIIDDEAN